MIQRTEPDGSEIVVDIVVGATKNKPVLSPVNSTDNTVTGTGTPGALVEVKDANGNVVGAGTVDENGNFEVSVPGMKDGDILYVTQNDRAGNYGPTQEIVVSSSIKKPILNPINESETNLSGTGVPNSIIKVYDENGNLIGTGVVDANGTFNVTIDPQYAGDKLSVTQEDRAGNKSEPTHIVVDGALSLIHI